MSLDLPASKIARPIMAVDENVSVTEASKAMVDNNRGSAIVTRKGETVGLLTERDILKRVVAKSRDPHSTKVKDVMTSSPITIDQNKPLREALELMNRKRIRRMLLTENGKIVGIFTFRDVLRNTRICTYCGKEIHSALETDRPEAYIECECGSRYHTKCVETVVHCVTCGKTIVTKVVYPEPSETFSG
jgi:signal-transduction protein with cAMP-binding, CBS, and nucleotidyltransferase domain